MLIHELCADGHIEQWQELKLAMVQSQVQITHHLQMMCEVRTARAQDSAFSDNVNL